MLSKQMADCFIRGSAQGRLAQEPDSFRLCSGLPAAELYPQPGGMQDLFSLRFMSFAEKTKSRFHGDCMCSRGCGGVVNHMWSRKKTEKGKKGRAAMKIAVV